MRPSGAGYPRAESDQLLGELPHRFPGPATDARGQGREAVTVEDVDQTFQGRGLPTGTPGERVKVLVPGQCPDQGEVSQGLTQGAYERLWESGNRLAHPRNAH